MARRQKSDPAKDPLGLHPNWAWCWPVNRRILYNRASVDLKGQPWDSRRVVIRWNEDAKKWEGDVPDGAWPPGAKLPFIMRPEGTACLFTTALADGPFPEHYEPVESPVRNQMSSVPYSPVCKVWEPDKIGDPREFPIVATTYRVCEHWQAGAMTRNMPWLVELVPDLFVELSPDLARRKGIQTGDWVRVKSKRGAIRARALVTNRFEPFTIDGKLVDQIGIPWHWGYAGLATGDSANLLTGNVGDPNTMIPEYKAFLCDVEKA
jgi:formate dehydrogenase major subunit